MNPLLEWLEGGDLRSDGLSPEITRFVLANPQLIGDLIQGLRVADDVIRGRAADAIEHIAREIPEALIPYQSQMIESLQTDPIPMVRWHLVMTMGHMALDWEPPEEACKILLKQLSDSSVFVLSWTIVSLSIYASLYPHWSDQIIAEMVTLRTSSSVAIRSRVRNATQALTHDLRSLPKGWIKSEKIKQAISLPL